MKVLKIFLLLSIILITTGCANDDTNINNSEPSHNNEPEISQNETTLRAPVERATYTEETKRLLSGDFFNEDSKNSATTSPTANPTPAPTPPAEVDTSLLSSYSTPILTTDENRYNNIKIVSDKLNGFILEPNTGFSFNDELGPYGKDDGFLEAKILLSNGEESTGYGGGVCQLSTTLYNAVKKLENIEITEHHNHSTPVAYVPKNQDATVSLQSGLDFKFINNYDYPIRFETTHNPNNLTVKIYKNT